MTAPIAAEKGPPRAAPYPALEKVAAVFKDFRRNGTGAYIHCFVKSRAFCIHH